MSPSFVVRSWLGILCFALPLVPDGNIVGGEPKPNEIVHIEFQGETVRCIVSPLGKLLLFRAGKGRRSEIYTADFHGRNAKQLTKNNCWDFQPCWSPNGETIAFCSNELKNFQIYSINLNGENKQQLTDMDYGVSHPTYSKTGLLSYKATIGPASRMGKPSPKSDLIVRRDGKDIKFLKEEAIITFGWSPNGKYMAVSIPSKVMILQDDGKEFRRFNLPDHDAQLSSHSAREFIWSPDNKEVAFHAPFFGGSEGDGKIYGDDLVFVIDLDGNFKTFDIGKLPTNAPSHVKQVAEIIQHQ